MTELLERPWSSVNLSFFEGSPLNEVATVVGVSWPGTYASTVRMRQTETSAFVANLSVTAAVVGSDTAMTVTLTREVSETIPAGSYWWDARHSDGTVRMAGKFIVKPTVTP